MTITAKIASVCPSCNLRIQPGTSVDWNPGQKARHITCPVHPADWTGAHEHLLRDGELRYYVSGTDRDDRSWEAWVAHLAAQTPTAPEPQRIPVDQVGVYVLPDGAIVKVQPNQEKTRTYAKHWTVISGTRLTEADTREHGEYVYEPGLVDEVARTGRKMTLDEAKAFILRYGQCARCGRGLKDATSVERGIGPVCVKYFSAGVTGAELLVAA
jgi:hypothetical protein